MSYVLPHFKGGAIPLTELAATLKMAKYSDLSEQNTFYPVTVVEMLGPFNETAYKLVGDLGKCIARLSSNDCESYFLFQHLSVVVQLHFNSILFPGQFFGC